MKYNSNIRNKAIRPYRNEGLQIGVVKMLNTVKEILGMEVVRVEGNNNLEIVEASAQYNKEMTVSVELLSGEETYYVTVLENDIWVAEGYFQAV